jgi:hypothetical protein
VSFETRVAGQPDTGGSTQVPARIGRSTCRAALGTAEYDSGWQEAAGPADVSVVWVDVELRDGRHYGAAPRLALSRRVHPWLARFRWVSLFLPRSSTAVRATAFDAHGRVVTRARSDQGLFICRRRVR